MSSCKCIENTFLKSCQKGDLKKVKACIDLGADVNVIDEDGTWKWFGLKYAAYYNYRDILVTLLSHPDIDVNAKDIFNMTALMIACIMGNIQTVQ